MFSLIEVVGPQRHTLSDRAISRGRSHLCCSSVRSERLRWKSVTCKNVSHDKTRLCSKAPNRLHSAPSLIRAAREVEFQFRTRSQDSALQSEAFLQDLIGALQTCQSYEEKVDLLRSSEKCVMFVAQHRKWLPDILDKLTTAETFVILCVIAMGQDHVLVREETNPVTRVTLAKCRKLAQNLMKLETFYTSLGGLLGYQLKSIQLLAKKTVKDADEDVSIEYLMPCFLDLSVESKQAKETVRSGIEAIPFMSEIYALGGSGDRLGLQCPESGDLLPSAMLPYCGRSMLDSMIRDLQARESLYFKLTGEQRTTPIAIMTSDAKDNDTRIKAMLESQNWYGRGEDAFFVFKQPLVPLLDTKTGLWLTNSPGKIVMRPGGHGVIWKLMWDEGVFDWLKSFNCKAGITRQVSNPLASTDTTLLGLSGLGYSQQKAMGFASCERVVGASEGMNVVQHRSITHSGKDAIHEYGVTNIEYTEFERLGLTDVAVGNNSSTSCFPANTNILYVSLDAAEKAVAEGIYIGGSGACLPGLIFNTKKGVVYEDESSGEVKECFAGRMECMMQNLADSLTDSVSVEMDPDALSVEQLSTFMVSNVRRKVTSSAKKKYKPGGSIRQTPEGSFWDLLLNARDILQQCGILVPEFGSIEEYLDRGPAFIFLFHPALGPLWSIISQKVKRGQLIQGSELVLEIAEARILNLNLDGSLIVKADDTVGHSSTHLRAVAETDGHSQSEDRNLEYSSKVGRIEFENVSVKNAGIDWDHHSNIYWKHEVFREEYCMVQLHGCSEFSAKDISITGHHVFDVPVGYRLTLIADSESDKGFREEWTQSLAAHPSWEWEYRLEENEVVLSHRSNSEGVW